MARLVDWTRAPRTYSELFAHRKSPSGGFASGRQNAWRNATEWSGAQALSSKPPAASMSGFATSDGFTFVVRSTTNDGCSVIFFGKYTNITADKHDSELYRSSGDCGF